MKLKTLKDLKQGGKDEFHNQIIEFVNCYELKAEAVKWVKESKKKFGDTSQCDFWMKRLNITEEDLI